MVGGSDSVPQIQAQIQAQIQVQACVLDLGLGSPTS